MVKEIKCPHCGDTWTYKVIIDHENGRSIVTDDFKVIEDWETLTCYKCHKQYKPDLSEVDFKMWDFVYQAWKSVKMS